MLVSKILLILSLAYRLYGHIRQDERYEDKDERTGARLATATIFLATVLLYYFAGIFNLTAQC